MESILCDRVESIEPMLSLKSVAILAKFIYDVDQHLYRSVATEKRARWNFRKNSFETCAFKTTLFLLASELNIASLN